MPSHHDSVIGRDGEVRAVLGAISAPGQAAVIAGEAGIGKTSLLHAVEAELGDSGCVILRAAPSRPEQALAYAALRDLIGDRLGEIPLPEPQHAAVSAALGLASANHRTTPEAVAFATHGALLALSAADGLVVSIDDAQWLDAPTVTALTYAIRRLREADVRLLLTVRAALAHAPAALAESLERWEPTVVTLGPLSLGAIQQILRSRNGTVPARPGLVKVVETAAGNPLFALELTRTSRTEQSELPRRINEAIGLNLDELDAGTIHVLAAASLLATPTVGVIAEATEHTSAEVRQLLESAPDLVRLDGDAVSITHPLIASCLADRLADDARFALHTAFAAVDLPLEERASHLLVAAQPGDTAAIGTLDAAAAAARARGAPTIASTLLERSAELSTGLAQGAVARRLRTAAELARDGGDVGHAADLARRALELSPDGVERAESFLTLAITDEVNQLDHARRALDHACGNAGIEARAHLLASDILFHRDGDAASLAAHAAHRSAERTTDRSLLAASLATVAYMDAATGRPGAYDHAQRALELQQNAEIFQTAFSPAVAIATIEMWHDRHDAARNRFETESRSARTRGDAYGEVVAGLHRAGVEWRAGRWDVSLSLCDEALASWATSGDASGVAAAYYQRAVVLAHLGRDDDARADISRARSEPVIGELTGARLDWVEAHLDLAAGRSDRAAQTLLGVTTTFASLGLREPGLRLSLSDTIDALTAVGAAEPLERLAAELAELAALIGTPRAHLLTVRARAGAAVARGDGEAAALLLEQAVATLTSLPVPFEHARTWLALGAIRRRARRTREARVAFERAGAIFDELGAAGWATRARDELARLSGRRQAPVATELSEAERRVAELVGRGCSNKETAAQLFVSVKTVETTLTHVYRKLAIRSRTELAAQIRDRKPNP